MWNDIAINLAIIAIVIVCVLLLQTVGEKVSTALDKR